MWGLRRFSGTLPNSWSDRRYFKNLQVLNLADNELTGLLPNRRWNKKKGFRELRELHLSDNKFYGKGRGGRGSERGEEGGEEGGGREEGRGEQSQSNGYLGVVLGVCWERVHSMPGRTY